MQYSSKKDWWIVLIVAFALVMIIATTLSEIVSRGIDHPAAWTLMGVSFFYIAIIYIFTYPVYYEITGSNLIIRSGLFRRTIPIALIDNISPTKNPLSAPAWSLDRLHIDYRKQDKKTYILISPENRDSFLRELVRQSPGLELKGDKVVRTQTD